MTPVFPASVLRTYRPERPLGAGGFGTVWLATHIELKRPVALKLLHAPPDDHDDALARFRDEAKIVASLQHPSIVKVLDHGVDDAQPWIVFEHVDGPDLRDILDRGPLTVPVALDIAAQMASALAEAHRHGVVHRDLKPDNVLMGAEGIAKLTDFGIAKWKRGSTQLTAPDVVLGSPQYIAPERILGSAPGPAADIYALGVLIFEMLTGDPPFRDLDTQEVLRKQLHVPAPRLKSVRPDVPDALDELVARLLEKDTARRPARATEVERALSRISGNDSSRSVETKSRPRAVSTVRAPGWRTQALRRAASPVGLGAALVVAMLAMLAPRLAPRPVTRAPASVAATHSTTADAALLVQLERFDAAAHRLTQREELLLPSATVSSSTAGNLTSALEAARVDLPVWHESVLLGTRRPAARARGWTGAGLAARGRGFAYVQHAQQLRLRAALDPGVPRVLDEAGGMLLAEYLEALPGDLDRALADAPRGGQLLGDMLADLLVVSRTTYAMEPLPRPAAAGIKRFRNALAARPGALATLARALWEHGKKNDVLKAGVADTWAAVCALRAVAPDLPGELFAEPMGRAVQLLCERETRHEQSVDLARRHWLILGDPPDTLIAAVRSDVDRAAAIESALDVIPERPPATAAFLRTMRTRAIGLHLRLYTLIDRLEVPAERKTAIGIATIAFKNAARVLDRAEDLLPSRVPLLTRYLDEVAVRFEAIAANEPALELDGLMLDLMDLARRARWSESYASERQRRAIEAWRERMRHLKGARGQALAAIAEGYWQLGLKRNGQPLEDALKAHLATLGEDGKRLSESSRAALGYAKAPGKLKR